MLRRYGPYSRELGHVAIIDVNPRRSSERNEAMKREATARRTLGYVFPEQRRYHERSTVERVYAPPQGRVRRSSCSGAGVMRRCFATSCSASWR